MSEVPMTTAEVSARLNIKPETLRYWRANGTGPRWFRLGGRRVMYLPSDVDNFLAEQYAATTR